MNKALCCVTPLRTSKESFIEQLASGPQESLFSLRFSLIFLGSGTDSQLSLLILLFLCQELVFFPPQNYYCPTFISHSECFHQLPMHSSPASTAYSCGSSPWLLFLLWTNSHLAIPSLLPHFTVAHTSCLTSRIVLPPPATLVAPIFPHSLIPSIVASLQLLLSEGCQPCPPVKVVLHALLSCLLMLHMQYLYSLTYLNQLMNSAFNKCFPRVKPI